MTGMRKNKSAIVRRRQCLLTVMAFALSILALWTGFMGFVYQPEADVPPDVPPITAPATAPATETTAETTAETAWEAIPKTAAQAVGETAAQTAPEAIAETAAESIGQAPLFDLPVAADAQEPTAETAEATAAPTGETTAGTAGEAATQMPSTDSPTDAETSVPEPVAQDAAPDHGLGRGIRLAMRLACVVFTAAACVDILLLAVLRKNIRNHAESGANTPAPPLPGKVDPIPITRKNEEQPLYPIPGISLGKLHDMGMREYQQDSFGQTPVLHDTGILAVLADGMGGLSGGEKVSRKIVMETLNYGAALQSGQLANALPDMVAEINCAVNQMLGPQGLYTSGSTVVSALITGGELRWISVGDSRVYLYRDGQLNQLSRDHDLMQDWMADILEGTRSMAEAMRDPDGRKLTSFIGMGELRYVDYNHTPIPLLPGDRVLLMSDGIYGTVSDDEMEAILLGSGNVQEAASHIGQKIAGACLSYQDNYTLVILGYDPPDQSGNRT